MEAEARVRCASTRFAVEHTEGDARGIFSWTPVLPITALVEFGEPVPLAVDLAGGVAARFETAREVQARPDPERPPFAPMRPLCVLRQQGPVREVAAVVRSNMSSKDTVTCIRRIGHDCPGRGC